jgi:hypothetical protein
MLRRLSSAACLAAAITCAVAAGAQAQAPTIVDFEQFSGPSVFSSTDPHPPLTVGIATFSGGQILRETSALPADQSSVYGTAPDCRDCQSTLTITFARPVKDFSTLVLNGLAEVVSYTVLSDSGETQTKTLSPNFESGADTFSLTAVGITSVAIRPSEPDPTFWDFFIDDVRFAEATPTSKDQCKNGGWQTYGVFKNQGDCVSFVTTGGKNPPGKKAG